MITYDFICEKLGFDPIHDQWPVHSTNPEEQYDGPGPFDVLSNEESEWLTNYMKNHLNHINSKAS
jgi:hypothetical protein